jgi:hypothetical protein
MRIPDYSSERQSLPEMQRMSFCFPVLFQAKRKMTALQSGQKVKDLSTQL